MGRLINFFNLAANWGDDHSGAVVVSDVILDDKNRPVTILFTPNDGAEISIENIASEDFGLIHVNTLYYRVVVFSDPLQGHVLHCKGCCGSVAITYRKDGSIEAPTTALCRFVNQLDTARRFMWNKVTRQSVCG